ncbi:MAG: DNA gyrase C-terminal beta-propeller domain-containing protein, partial [Acutalibacteraceae bacterium]|nr:DNA gyrase C-terminal beta-propeller domain-containing protein [Acutalibacteraceae bacterium]
IKTEALNLRDKFSDDRRTDITDVAGEVDIEDLIPEEQCVLTKTYNGFIKRLPADTYSVQHRGGRGITGMTTREDDAVENMFVCSSHDYIMLFSNLGRMYRIKAYEIPEGSRTAKGMNIVNILPLMPEEKITIILPASELDEDHFVTMVTKKGIIKRTKLSEFRNTRKSGIIAISIDEDDELTFVKMTEGDDNLLIATKKGMAIQFNENGVRAMGRGARGVKAITIKEDDEVVAMAVTSENTRLLTITETGYGRVSMISDYRLQSRGGKGLINYRVDKYGDVAAVLEVTDEDDIIMIASNGILIRIFSGDISTFARPAKGVRVMRVGEGEKVLSVAVTEHSEEEETSLPDAPDADAGLAEDNSPEEEAVSEE